MIETELNESVQEDLEIKSSKDKNVANLWNKEIFEGNIFLKRLQVKWTRVLDMWAGTASTKAVYRHWPK